jgi:hypothetical protein
VTESELRFAFDTWVNRSTQPEAAIASNNLIGGPPPKAVIMHAMVEYSTATHTFDISISKKAITRIDPKLKEEFPFIFDNVEVGDEPAKVAIQFELKSIDKWRGMFQKMRVSSEDMVAFSHMRCGDVDWVLKMWRQDDDTIRVMYIRDYHQNSVGRLLLEGLGRVSN